MSFLLFFFDFSFILFGIRVVLSWVILLCRVDADCAAMCYCSIVLCLCGLPSTGVLDIHRCFSGTVVVDSYVKCFPVSSCGSRKSLCNFCFEILLRSCLFGEEGAVWLQQLVEIPLHG